MRRLVLLALAAGTAFAGNAFAANSPIGGSFQVRANVPGSCVIVSDSGINFGTYDPVDVNKATADTASGSIVIRCTKGSNYRVTLDQGTHADTGSTCTAPLRRMANAAGTEFINYVINGDDNATWGCTPTTNDRGGSATSSNADISFTTNGVAAADQDVGTGLYTDVVTYQVTF